MSFLKSNEGAAVSPLERDNGELYWMLASVGKNAPWMRRIFVLVNGAGLTRQAAEAVALPPSLELCAEGSDKRPESGLTCVEFVDRCAYLEPQDCPTFNSFVVRSVAHKVYFACCKSI